MRAQGVPSPGLFGPLHLLLLVLLLLSLATVASGRRGNRHPDDGTEDFEFEEETQAAQRRRNPKTQDTDISPTFPSYHGGKKNSQAKHTQDSELCLALRCSRDEYCLVKNENVALCVSSKKSHKDRKLLPTPSQLLSSAAEDDESDDDESSSDDDDTSSSEYDDEASWERARASACTSCPAANKPTFVCGSDNKTYSSPCRLHYHNCVHRSSILLACKGFCPCQESKAKHDQKQKLMTHRWNNFVSKYRMTKEQKNNSAHPVGSSSTATPPNHLPEKSGTTTVSKLRKPNKTEFSSEQIKYKHNNKQNNKSTSNAVGNPPFAEDKERQKGYNSVLSEKVPTPSSKDKVECSSQDLESMQSRMLDWFGVVMADAKRNKNKRRSRTFGKGAVAFPSRCPQEVQWIFGHLDADEDGRLGLRELLDLEREGRERCVRPFLDHCDSGHDLVLSPAEWCACFDHSERPCLAAKRKSRNGLLGGFTPTCAEDGFFAATQCHGGAGLCWCVDRHGVEYANTRTRGTPDCDTISGRNASTSTDTNIEDDNEDDDDDDDDGDDDSMMEGSADHPLDI